MNFPILASPGAVLAAFSPLLYQEG
jgi:hypothetical protein